MSGLVPAEAGGAAGPRRQAVTATAVRGLSRFADIRGIPASREFLLDYDVIEAFCVAGLPGRAPSTRGTYRSALYRLARRCTASRGSGRRRSRAPRAPTPYSAAERAELAAIAAAQRDPANRASALAVVVFGIGAGLRPGELVALRGSDVTRHGRQRGGACRRAGRAGGAGHRGLRRPRLGAGPPRGQRFRVPPRPGRPQAIKNFVTNFTRGLAADPAAPRLSLRRARSSFICGHMAAGTPLRELLAITGISQAESLARYARHVDGAPAKAALRAWDRRRGVLSMDGGGLEIPGPAAPRTSRPWRLPPGSSTAAAGPRSSRPRWRTAPGGPGPLPTMLLKCDFGKASKFA